MKKWKLILMQAKDRLIKINANFYLPKFKQFVAKNKLRMKMKAIMRAVSG